MVHSSCETTREMVCHGFGSLLEPLAKKAIPRRGTMQRWWIPTTSWRLKNLSPLWMIRSFLVFSFLFISFLFFFSIFIIYTYTVFCFILFLFFSVCLKRQGPPYFSPIETYHIHWGWVKFLFTCSEAVELALAEDYDALERVIPSLPEGP